MQDRSDSRGLQLRSLLCDQSGTFQYDIFLTFLLGLLFSMFAPQSDQQRTLLKRRSFVLGFLFNLVVGVGIAVTAYAINPDWMWMYWVDPKGIPVSHVAVIFGLTYPAWFVLGYLIAPHLDQAGWGWRVVGLVSAFEIIFIGATIHRVWQVGTFEQFATGETVKILSISPLSFTTLSIALLIGFAVAVPTLIGLLMHLHRLSAE